MMMMMMTMMLMIDKYKHTSNNSLLMIGGMKLIPTSAYGVRLYQNGSSLMMHQDKVAMTTMVVHHDDR